MFKFYQLIFSILCLLIFQSAFAVDSTDPGLINKTRSMEPAASTQTKMIWYADQLPLSQCNVYKNYNTGQPACPSKTTPRVFCSPVYAAGYSDIRSIRIDSFISYSGNQYHVNVCGVVTSKYWAMSKPGSMNATCFVYCMA